MSLMSTAIVLGASLLAVAPLGAAQGIGGGSTDCPPPDWFWFTFYGLYTTTTLCCRDIWHWNSDLGHEEYGGVECKGEIGVAVSPSHGLNVHFETLGLDFVSLPELPDGPLTAGTLLDTTAYPVIDAAADTVATAVRDTFAPTPDRGYIFVPVDLTAPLAGHGQGFEVGYWKDADCLYLHVLSPSPQQQPGIHLGDGGAPHPAQVAVCESG